MLCNTCVIFYLQMDQEGYLPVSLIANFQRVRNLTTDEKLIYKVSLYGFLAYMTSRSSTFWPTWPQAAKIDGVTVGRPVVRNHYPFIADSDLSVLI